MNWQEIISTFSSSTIEYQFLKSLENFVASQIFVVLVAFLKTVSFLVTAFLVILIVYLYLKTNVFTKKDDSTKTSASPKSSSGKNISRRISRLKEKLKNNLPEEDRNAVIEADACLMEALASLGLKGKPFKELVADKNLWRSANVAKLGQAHEIRNRAVHFSEPLTHAEAVEAVENFEKALKDLSFL